MTDEAKFIHSTIKLQVFFGHIHLFKEPGTELEPETKRCLYMNEKYLPLSLLLIHINKPECLDNSQEHVKPILWPQG